MQQERRLGDAEREDLSEIVAIGTLEIASVHANEGWLLKVVAENEAGPHVLSTDGAAAAEQNIDLDSFYREFIRPGLGTANVSAEVENQAAQARVNAVIDQIERNYHSRAN